MNKNQLSFQIGRFRDLYIDSFLTLAGISVASFGLKEALNIRELKDGIYLSLYMLPFAALISYELKEYKYAFIKYVLKKNISERNAFDRLDYIKISDQAGLENLLNRTMNNELKEWSTFHRGEINGDTIIINKILNNEELKEDGVTVKRYITAVRTNYLSSNYNGYIHYHPSIFGKNFGSINYYVSLGDRFGPDPNSINLLCFNTGHGPEIIGFNRVDTFIPKNKNDKSFLVKADKKMILDYLK